MKWYRWAAAGAVLAPLVGCMPWLQTSAPEIASAYKPQQGTIRFEREVTTTDKSQVFYKLAQNLDKERIVRACSPEQPAERAKQEQKYQEDLRCVVTSYEVARELNPAAADPSAARMAVLYDQLNEPAKAWTEFQRALKQNAKDANLLNNIGYHFYNAGNWTEAEKYYREALAVDANHQRARMNLGLALAQQGRNQEALDTFCKTIKQSEAYENLGFVALARGQKNEARAYYTRAWELNPGSERVRTALTRMDR